MFTNFNLEEKKTVEEKKNAEKLLDFFNQPAVVEQKEPITLTNTMSPQTNTNLGSFPDQAKDFNTMQQLFATNMQNVMHVHPQ